MEARDVESMVAEGSRHVCGVVASGEEMVLSGMVRLYNRCQSGCAFNGCTLNGRCSLAKDLSFDWRSLSVVAMVR